MAGQKTVLVTGAGGQTGKIVLEKLLAAKDKFSVRGLVHSSQSAQRVHQETGIPAQALYTADITEAASPGLSEAMDGIDALIIATSAVPKLKKLSLPGAIFGKITGGSGMPGFYYNQMPEQVDWLGQKNQIDAAVKAGVKRVVLISSMGGTDPNHMLNRMGDGQILVFKRKAEEYLMSQKGVDFTILHPGGLTNDREGERELVFGVDDDLMKSKERRIPRGDVAELCVQSLVLPEASNRSIDVVSRPGTATTDYRALFKTMAQNCDYNRAPQSLPGVGE
ncbi:hypothetical protein WJX73_001523 [Symbiochloris irregularis]|uniref:NAD(P)-binding domain-containing protein n=1 Tax=Symbiochloris irregularis TaxID=706552 RepID=A0AAW1P9E8_9CHLO